MQMVMDLGAREICNVYGLTETYGNCSVTDAHDPADVRLHTVGRPLPGMEIRIVDRETRRPLPPGEVGEILVRGHLTPGYYKDPEQQRRRLRRRGIPRDRRPRPHRRRRAAPVPRAHQGDGQDAAGSTWRRSRSRRSCSAIPPSSRRTSSGCPIRARRRSSPPCRPAARARAPSPEALRAFCKQALAAFKVPQAFRVLRREELPVTATGKVQKFRLAEMLAAKRAG